ncbi:hypothetical protein TCAL_02632 [Tigriopus californicus]|uniref:EamA domain-containing protein n=1 Tax=Tigriopus californicus TaxID=6832 RepID=A0A553NG43_TIGCA|nr:uncharacterized protein LOC131888308 [Tigriopus californicus]TRY64391.1 hypothetical protein TCAL_02632 [Tigriopus californicus]|eukprot:TCALIF_02632-PA protein Name:"Protein of unknown function" AED:0.27 eAED:0.40 QI:0/-1/0/1/-1/1/1/0/356
MAANCITVANNYAVTIFTIESVEFLFIRTPLQMLICGGIAGMLGNRFVPSSCMGKILVASVSFAWAFAIFFAVTAVRLLPVGEFVVLVYTSPIMTVICSAILLKTKPSILKALLLIVLLVGTILVVQPPILFQKEHSEPSGTKTPNVKNQTLSTNEYKELVAKLSILEDDETVGHLQEIYPHYWMGVIMSLGCSFCVGIGHVLVAKNEEVTVLVLNFYVGLFSGIIALICSFSHMENRIFTEISAISTDQWIVMVVFSILVLASMQLIFLANKLATPTLTAMFRSMEIVITLIMDVVLFNDVPGWLSLLGTCLVLTSVLMMPFLDHVIAQLSIKIRSWTRRSSVPVKLSESDDNPF